jgi:ribonuclease HII
MIQFEKNLYKNNIKYIAGVDEVGRGPLAGPLVVSAVLLDIERISYLFNEDFTNYDVLPESSAIYTQINDSKQLTSAKRLRLNEFIRNEALDYSIVEISHTQVDEFGMSEALQIAFYDSIKKLTKKPEHVLTDSLEIKRLTSTHQTNIIRGDSLSISIAAASIVAKVYRDSLMIKLHDLYPHYGFDRNKGYGTKEHMEALKKHGPCDIHRKSFEPVRSMFNN